MAKYDQGGRCACGLKRECDCTKVITFSQKQYNNIGKQHRQDLMVEGFGALPVVPPKYVAANDNAEGRMPLADALGDWYAPAGGQYIGLRRPLSSDGGQVGGFDVPSEVQPLIAAMCSIASSRTGDFMQTATGRKFWPLDPRADEVFIEDIAHSLSLQCRYAGHCLRFYSVAEHCVLMARKLRWEGVDVALYALLHDAAEAYTVDVPRPLKRHLVGYKEAEAKVMAAIAARFDLAVEMPAVVHDADNRIIGDELANLVPMDWHDRYAGEELGVELRYWSPEKAREEFMATFDALMDCRARGMA
jgi:hypothetical protein